MTMMTSSFMCSIELLDVRREMVVIFNSGTVLQGRGQPWLVGRDGLRRRGPQVESQSL